MQGSPVQFDFEDLSPVEKRLNVEVPREQVNSKLDEAYRKLSREVNLRGFRKGKAPRPLLEKLFGKRVALDVAQQLVSDSMLYISQQHEMRMAIEPTIEKAPEVRKDQPLRYTAKIELTPQVVAQGYDGIEVSLRPAKVTDEDVAELLEQRRQGHNEMIPIEGREVTGDKDVLALTISGHIGPNQYNNQELNVDLGDPRTTPVPGLREALTGLPLTAKEHPIKFTLPTAAENPQDPGAPESTTPAIAPEMAGKECELKVTIRTAHEKRVPELDDDFAKDTGEAETLDEFKTKLRAQLLEEDGKEAKEEMRMQLLDELLKRNPVPLPPTWVKKYTHTMMEQLVRQAQRDAMMSGRDPRDPKLIDPQTLEETAQREAVKNISLEFLLTAVADKEQIEITNADVEKRVAELARQQDKGVSRLKAELQKEDPQLQHLRNQMRVEKALDLLESRAKIKQEESA